MSSKAGPPSSRRPPAPNGAAPKPAVKGAKQPPAIQAEKMDAAAKGADRSSTPTDRGRKSVKGGKSGKGGASPRAAPLPSAQATGAADAVGGTVKTGAAGARGGPAPKDQYLSEELLSRKPLDAKLRDQLASKCGKAQQDVKFTRNEAKRPAGRPEGAPSRHERVPPSAVVLMFNGCESSFELIAGDIATLPEAETIDLRSLTSGRSIGRMKIAPEKNTPVEDRIEFPNEWSVGSEHGERRAMPRAHVHAREERGEWLSERAVGAIAAASRLR